MLLADEKSMPIIFSSSEKSVAGTRRFDVSVEDEAVLSEGIPREERSAKLPRDERLMPNAERSNPWMPPAAAVSVEVDGVGS